MPFPRSGYKRWWFPPPLHTLSSPLRWPDVVQPAVMLLTVLWREPHGTRLRTASSHSQDLRSWVQGHTRNWILLTSMWATLGAELSPAKSWLPHQLTFWLQSWQSPRRTRKATTQLWGLKYCHFKPWRSGLCVCTNTSLIQHLQGSQQVWQNLLNCFYCKVSVVIHVAKEIYNQCTGDILIFKYNT